MKRNWKPRILGVAAAVCIAAGLSASEARAGEGPSAAEARSAEELAAQAFEFYKKGQYAEAIALYVRAHQLAPTGVLLFNVARIYDQKLADRGQASEYYRRAIAAPDLDPELTKRAQARLAALQAEPPPRPAPAAPARPEPAAGRASAEGPAEGGASWLKTTGLVAAGVGLVGLGVGSAFGLSAINKNDDAGKLCQGSACRSPEALTLTEDARDAARVSTVLFVAGGALVAGGLGAFLLAPSGGAREAPPAASGRLRLAPEVSPRGAGLALVGRWP
jgi:tetratricopeptide (TPR) repeat protein